MTQATTVKLRLTLPNDIDLDDSEECLFTIEQDGFALSKTSPDVAVARNIVDVTLSQDDTINFTSERKARIQLNWVYSDGTRCATKIKEIDVYENLHKKVIDI